MAAKNFNQDVMGKNKTIRTPAANNHFIQFQKSNWIDVSRTIDSNA